MDTFGNYFVFDKADGKIYFLEMEEIKGILKEM